MQQVISWKNSVKIFSCSVILRQLGIAIGIPFGFMGLILGLTLEKSVYTLYALSLIGALLFFTWIFIILLYGGRYETEFLLDKNGVLCRTQLKQQKMNRNINTLTFFLGLIFGKSSVMGAGMLAQSKQEIFLKWGQIIKVKYKPHNYVIFLRGDLMENIALFCTKDNYSLVEQFVKLKIQCPKK